MSFEALQAFDGRLYVPAGRPARDQIPYQHAPIGWPRARRLLATYTAVIDVSARAISTLDNLAGTMSTTSRSLSQTRALAAQPIRNDLAAPYVQSLEQDTHHSAQPEPGALGQVIRDLSISEPATLLRAVALDQAVEALTADAKAQSQRRAAALDTPARLTTHPRSPATPRPGQHGARSVPVQAQIKRDR